MSASEDLDVGDAPVVHRDTPESIELARCRERWRELIAKAQECESRVLAARKAGVAEEIRAAELAHEDAVAKVNEAVDEEQAARRRYIATLNAALSDAQFDDGHW